jgi:lactate permease
MTTLLAAAPILAILALMLGLRWSAARAGAVGFGLAVSVAVGVFGYGARVHADAGTFGALGGAMAEAAFTSATILWIILPALCIYHLQSITGGIDVLRGAMLRLSPDPRVAAVLVAWFFTLFLEGAAGFGTPVALAAPFLVGMGFRPLEAVSVALVGHAVGVSFGAVGTPVLPQIAATGFSGLEIAESTARMHAILGTALLLFMLLLLSRSEMAERFVGRRRPWWVLAAAALFLVPYYLLARWVGPELPTLGGALVGGLGFVLVTRVMRRGRGSAGGDPALHEVGDGTGDGRSIVDEGSGIRGPLRAAAPYLVLVGLILLTRLVPPLQALASAPTLRWELMEVFRGAVQPLYHPGTMLALGFLGGALLQGASGRDVAAAVLRSTRQLAPLTIALLAMLGLSRLMVHAGMIDDLAAAAAGATGAGWPLLAPAVGVLGTFVTGSATASNILMTDFQVATARGLDLPALPLVGAQGFGAAVGNTVAPHNIIAGGATVGLVGREAEVLRRTAVPCLVYTALGGVLAWIITLV